jgi:NodT family efflux transporter outer membrane factor (OMF) lipoprotein
MLKYLLTITCCVWLSTMFSAVYATNPLVRVKNFWLAKPTPKQQLVVETIKTQQLPSHWQTQPISSITLQPTFPVNTWWEALPSLQGLKTVIPYALQANPTFQAIQQQVSIAQQQMKLVQAQQLPQASFGASYLWQQYGKNQFVFPLSERVFHSFQLPITLSYELDTWGKNQNRTQSAKLGVLLAKTQVQTAQIQLASLVASTYVNVVRLQDLLTLQQQIVHNRQAAVTHQQQLVRLNQAPADTVLSLQQQVKTALVEQQNLARSLQLAQHQLGLLMGQTPTQFSQQGTTVTDTLIGQAFPTSVAAGQPSELVLHRPDVQAVELELKQAGIAIAVARKEFLPSLQLTASSGLSAVGANNVFKWSSLSSYLSPSIYQPLFTGGQLKAQLKISQLTYEQLLKNYLATLQTAFTEVEDSLTTFSATAQIYQQIEQQVVLAQQAEQQALKRQRASVETVFPVLQAEVLRLEYQQAKVQQTAQGMIDVISLTKALGGGLPPVSTN